MKKRVFEMEKNNEGFGVAFVTLVMAEILVRYSGKSLTYSMLYYLVPIISIPILYLILFRKFYFENLKG